MGRPVLAIGGIALIGTGIAIGLGWGWPSTAEANTRITQQIHTVRFDVDSSDVTVRTEDVSATVVRQRLSYHLRSRPDDAFQVDGDQLVLTECGHNCSAQFEVVVPRGTAVTGAVTSGKIELEAPGTVDVRATSGEIDITLEAPQDVRATATSGEINLTVPNDRYRVAGDTGSGDRRIDVATDPAAPHLLDLNSTSGDVTVRPS
ncbi:MAG TPA: DUF4097 family beta strand repeat-containing protein [Amycolatopsis sp.]|uniref:DUF4097 family beta strand repeat-containing protein n=1 Tax=Amycolatopsis sp. TaxID=37632 RepID=UPI002B4A5554|nr:DUF4097 family beta strand repeat-containing protein [Amycolatopsis sp.]HKS45621.1 DUF4097 family beta strand repeat-containing protein [Amycolatopsis sp.]